MFQCAKGIYYFLGKVVEMSCVISAFIVHKLVRENNQLRAEQGRGILPMNDSIQRLMDKLHEKYIQQGGRSFGTFENDQVTFPISRFLEDSNIILDDTQFYDLSLNILQHLVAKASHTSATGGWVVMCLYQHNNHLNLAVAVVNEVVGAGINENFEVEESIYIDLSKLRHAGRIDLTKWQNGANNYVSFIKAIRDSTYFKEFLGCNTTINSVVESNSVIDAIHRYCHDNNLNYEDRKAIESRAYDFLKSASQANAPINLEHLANAAAPEDSENLKAFLSSDEFQINDGFVPDLRSLKKLLELTTKSSFWNIKINREAFNNGADYDPETKILTIPVTDPNDQEEFAKEVQGREGDD